MRHVSAFLFFIAFAALFTISGNEKALLEPFFFDEASLKNTKNHADKLIRKFQKRENDINRINFKSGCQNFIDELPDRKS